MYNPELQPPEGEGVVEASFAAPENEPPSQVSLPEDGDTVSESEGEAASEQGMKRRPQPPKAGAGGEK